jgi:UDPglucose 6-dehydrogenase
MEKKIKIGIIGVGMVGTPLMKWFLMKKWKRGKNLFCYDADPKKNFRDDISKTAIVFICVPTPSNPDGSCNISILESVIKEFPDKETRCVVIKSTVPPGTTASLGRKYREKGHFLFNPEFLTEAKPWEDFINPDRQIVAVGDVGDKESQGWAKIVLDILPAAEKTLRVCGVSSTEAELTKYAANVFGAMKVVFFNILAKRCDIFGANFENVRQMVVSDKRIGPSWSIVPYNGYFGYGGFCFIKDTDASIASDEKMLNDIKESGKKEVFSKAIDFFKAMRAFNETLLASQSLAPQDVCFHDEELKKKLNLREKEKSDD